MTTGERDGADDCELLVKLLYKAVLGRDIEPDGLTARAGLLASGGSFADMFREVALSEEAQNIRHTVGSSFDEEGRAPLVHAAIRFAYAHFLRRTPTAEDVTHWAGVILSGMPVEKFLSEIAGSEEALFKASVVVEGESRLSDGEFLMAASATLFGRGLMPTETVAWQRQLESGKLTRAEMIRASVDERIRAASRPPRPAAGNDSDLCTVLGTSRMLSRDQWNKRADELHVGRRSKPGAVPLVERRFHHSGDYVVSMIASLYKGRSFITKFLENIVSQTLFERSELIIIDADSPELEGEIIEAYQDVYPNIVYKRINYRLGIYDAWNVGVGLSRGRYLTNTNLDDLRRRDSIELQAGFLDAEPNVDVVYQDFYYSFDSDLDFEDVEAFGFKSELPILTPNNLLMFNSPHNAPMWRKGLHDQVGLFNTRYKSAGDYEFWVRCLEAGKSFRKINSPHVVYYQNPKGISTRPDTRGVEEAHEILCRYGPKLTRSALLQSRRDFHAGLGIEDIGLEDGEDKSYYEVVQAALIDLGRRRMHGSVPPSQGSSGADESSERRR